MFYFFKVNCLILNIFFNNFLYFLFFLNILINRILFLFQSNILWTYIARVCLSSILTRWLWSSRLIPLLFLTFTTLIQMLDQIFILFSFFFIQSCKLLLFSISLTQLCLENFVFVLKFIDFSFELVQLWVLDFWLLWSSWAWARVRRGRSDSSFILLVCE